MKKRPQNGDATTETAAQRARQLSFRDNLQDFKVLYFGHLGLSTVYIARKTHMSTGQVSYRLKKGMVKLSTWRNGQGPAFRSLQGSVVERALVETIKRRVAVLERLPEHKRGLLTK